MMMRNSLLIVISTARIEKSFIIFTALKLPLAIYVNVFCIIFKQIQPACSNV